MIPAITAAVEAVTDCDFDAYVEHVGLRVDDAAYAVGEYLPDSRVWTWEGPTEDVLNGTSAIELRGAEDMDAAKIARAAKLADDYVGDHLYVIGGDSVEYGEDPGEVIIRRARVIAIIRRA